MSFSMPGRGPSAPQMNVTPLIDVLLVLLIIFMLVVIEQKPTGLQAQIPQPAPKENIPPPDQTIVIQIRQAPTGAQHPLVKVNQEVVEWDHLRERLRDIYAIRVERIIYLEADNDIEFQDVGDVIAIAKIAGVDKVGLLTEDGKHAAMTG